MGAVGLDEVEDRRVGATCVVENMRRDGHLAGSAGHVYRGLVEAETAAVGAETSVADVTVIGMFGGTVVGLPAWSLRCTAVMVQVPPVLYCAIVIGSWYHASLMLPPTKLASHVSTLAGFPWLSVTSSDTSLQSKLFPLNPVPTSVA